ncbi:MAG: hypothetical protein ACOYNN_15770 [Terrimicrobiaceae bacterium]
MTNIPSSGQSISAAPILFIHYGPAEYLRWTFDCAARTNRGGRIIFLGDESNRRFARGQVEFFSFERFSKSEKIARFESVFQVVQGERHRYKKHGGVEVWLKFVFLRWFLIEEFLRVEGIDAFWTFDSDTLILTELASREERFADVEASTQCRGRCLNGWVGSRRLVERYTDCIIELFSDPAYLANQRERLKTQSGLSFNEMDAFAEFQAREKIRTRRAADVIDGEAFDDALAFSEDYQVSPDQIVARLEVKRLWASPAGGLFARLRESGALVRLLTCNMSWMPDYLTRRLSRYGRRSPGRLSDGTQLREVSLKETGMEKLRRSIVSKAWNWRV